MNKRISLHILLLIIALLIITFGFYSTVIANKTGQLQNFALTNKTVNIHLGEFRSLDKARDIEASRVAEALGSRLKQRKTVAFNIVKSIEEADLSISADLIEFIYSEGDPVDILLPLGLVVDVLTKKNYARLEFEINVLDTKKNKVVWKRYLKATLTEDDMSKEKSIPLIIDRAAYVIVKECFGRSEGSLKF